MRIAVFCTCPKGIYSGGRYHAFMIAACLARRGHEAYFVTNNAPIFEKDLAIVSRGNAVRIVEAKDFDVTAKSRFDAVFVAPQMNSFPRYYHNAINFARRSGAALILINYESANWFNKFAPNPRPEENWDDWRMLASQGTLVLSSADESQKFAKEFYTDIPPETAFDVWRPAINSDALAIAKKTPSIISKDQDYGAGRILAFSRPSDKHKGADDLLELMGPELSGYTFSTIIGNRRNSDDYLHQMNEVAEKCGMLFEPLFSLSDIEKFRVISSAKAVVFPTYFEGYGYPPVEALAAGTPCVSYDLPVIRENCGDLIEYAPVGNVAALRAALVDILERGERPPTDSKQIKFLSDIDVRAEKLEQTLLNYINRLSKSGLSAKTPIDQITCDASLVSEVPSGNGRTDLFLIVQTEIPIAHIGADIMSFSACDVKLGAWENNRRRNAVLLSTQKGVDGFKSLETEGLTVGFDGGACVRLNLKDIKRSNQAVHKLSPDFIRISRYFPGKNDTLVLGVIHPKFPYDGAFLIDASGGLTPLSLGLKDGNGKKFDECENEFCGFTCQISNEAIQAGNFRLILTRRGSVVGFLSLGELSLAGAKKERSIQIGARFGKSAKGLNLSEGVRSSDHIKLRGWSDNYDIDREFFIDLTTRKNKLIGEQEIHQRLRLSANVLRTDILKKLEIGTPIKLGFEHVLPVSADMQAVTCQISLNARGKRLSSMPPLNLGKPGDPIRLQEIQVASKELKPAQNTDHLIDAGVRAIANVFRHTPGERIYDCSTRSLLIAGRVNCASNVRVELWDKAASSILASVTHDLIKLSLDEKIRDDDLRPLPYQFKITCEPEDISNLALKIVGTETIIDNIELDDVSLKSVDEFRVTDFSYDARLSTLWMRGLFSGPNMPIDELTVSVGGAIIAHGIANVHRRHKEDRHAGWCIECVVNTAIKAGDIMTIRARTPFGALQEITYVAPDNASTLSPLHDERGVLAIASGFDDTVSAEHYLSEGSVPLMAGAKEIVLLVLHNLDAPERPEKRYAMERLRENLNKSGVDLICLHHSVGRVNCNIPEINYFDPWLEIETKRPSSDDAQSDGEDDSATDHSIDFCTRMLYGFEYMRRRKPVSWDVCKSQVNEEKQRLEAVFNYINPRAVLLWHQWNSLMHIGRELSTARNIPSGIVHEGMLPNTLTIDQKGMMAEARSAGAKLDATAENTDRSIAAASKLITRLADERADRKVQFSFPIVDQLRDRIGPDAKLIFYAGINDWQSGVLPADYPHAKTHSPHFRDTEDALKALIEAAERNDWWILYKAHPNLQPRMQELDHDRLLVVREAKSTDCILAADATATILSSLSYISMIQKKPTVLLGRNTMSDVGAAYELTGRANLDQCLSAALSRENFETRLDAFKNHVAALLNEHLFPYGEESKNTLLSYDDAAQSIMRLWR